MLSMNSLCIPRAMSYTTSSDVEGVFNVLFGKSVERVDERKTTDSQGQDFKMFYIHFQPLHQQTGLTQGMRDFNAKMEADGVVHVMTGRGKWFWKVYPNRSTKAFPTPVGPRIMTKEDEDLFLQWKETRQHSLEAFTSEEIHLLDQETGLEKEEFTEEELDELDASQTHNEEEELLAIAENMAKA